MEKLSILPKVILVHHRARLILLQSSRENFWSPICFHLSSECVPSWKFFSCSLCQMGIMSSDSLFTIRTVSSYRTTYYQIRSDQMSHLVMSNSLRPHESQHARPPCPSPTPGVHPDSRPLSQYCHPAISSSVNTFSSCPQSLPASESLPMSQLFAWGGQSTGVSALASFLPKKSFRMDWLDLLAVQGTLKSLLQHHSSKASILQCSAFFTVHSQIHTWPQEKW